MQTVIKMPNKSTQAQQTSPSLHRGEREREKGREGGRGRERREGGRGREREGGRKKGAGRQ